MGEHTCFKMDTSTWHIRIENKKVILQSNGYDETIVNILPCHTVYGYVEVSSICTSIYLPGSQNKVSF